MVPLQPDKEDTGCEVILVPFVTVICTVLEVAEGLDPQVPDEVTTQRNLAPLSETEAAPAE